MLLDIIDVARDLILTIEHSDIHVGKVVQQKAIMGIFIGDVRGIAGPLDRGIMFLSIS